MRGATIAILFLLWAGLTAMLAYGAYISRNDAQLIPSTLAEWRQDAIDGADAIVLAAQEKIEDAQNWGREGLEKISALPLATHHKFSNVKESFAAELEKTAAIAEEKMRPAINATLSTLSSILDVHENKNISHDNAEIIAAPPVVENGQLTLSEMKRRSEEAMAMEAMLAAQIEPTAQTPPWGYPESDLEAQAVLVPHQVTVISSAQDGRIADMPFANGDVFKQGDMLVAYDCAELEAEAEIVRMEKVLTGQKAQGSDRLFKLDIISDLDRIGAIVQDGQAAAKTRLYRARLEDCLIKARFDGRVTNRLANPGEYTRTDRVLLEVASLEPLKAEFLIPSKWLRWVNIGAPVSIILAETEQTYTAHIIRIHGEVDPVSQSIQVVAALDPYQDPLLPGMSGRAVIAVNALRDAGIIGFLEQPGR
jgi:RND family efflux transporter MFP subunit